MASAQAPASPDPPYTGWHVFFAKLLEACADPRKLMAMHTVEERLEGIPPEEVLQGLSPEQRAGLFELMLKERSKK